MEDSQEAIAFCGKKRRKLGEGKLFTHYFRRTKHAVVENSPTV
jgi:hypothetical protein